MDLHSILLQSRILLTCQPLYVIDRLRWLSIAEERCPAADCSDLLDSILLRAPSLGKHFPMEAFTLRIRVSGILHAVIVLQGALLGQKDDDIFHFPL